MSLVAWRASSPSKPRRVRAPGISGSAQGASEDRRDAGSTLIPAIVAAGADLGATTPSGRNALHFAVMRGDMAMRPIEPVVELLDGGISVDARDASGYRALTLAIHPALVPLLLARGADPVLSAVDRQLLGAQAARLEAAIVAAR